MKLTAFGKAIRKARIDANETLKSMAMAINTSPSFLSGMETGCKKIPPEYVEKIILFFKSKNVEVEDLYALACVSNNVIPLKGLPLPQQLLLAEIAKSPMTTAQIKKIQDCFDNH